MTHMRKKKHHTPKPQIFDEIKSFFSNYSSHLQLPENVHADIIGGEPLLHPDISSIAEELFKYRNLYSTLRIVTNCTVAPPDDLLELINSLDPEKKIIYFYLSNYGELSKKAEEIKKTLQKYNIPFSEVYYFGDNPEYGGWVDMGFENEDIPYSLEIAAANFNNCRFAVNRCIPIHNGYVFLCTYAMGRFLKGLPPVGKGELLKISGGGAGMITNDIQGIIRGKFESAPEICCKCNGFDVKNSLRLTPAIQIT